MIGTKAESKHEWRLIKILIFIFIISSLSYSQTLKIYHLSKEELVTLDGSLKEEFWQRADSIENLKMIEPIEGVPPTFRTVIRVAADQQNLYFGVICYDKEPDKITSISKIRDALASEDRIVFVLDTHLDQRTGYIFSINPGGTRYDALVSNFGESENASWDAIWNASTMITN